ncbi:GAF domain-containing sensor histidine kinase [Pseudocolwellia sp. HL-MZ7]|uniref:GAF domain-containing sensor histidine kinase n=1 Tax=Pseudocolwellia sp. HL-MZ7 TaxID=3400627 RepID=UPI003CF5B4F8
MKHSETPNNSNLNYGQLLDRYFLDEGVLSIAFDDAFNNVLCLTNRVCESSFSQINIIGHTKYWRKTDIEFTTGYCETTHALSEIVIKHNELFEVSGILEDNRIINHPIFINDINIKHYAAIPITLSDRSVIGTLCLMNSEACLLTEDSKSALLLMVKNIASQIELYLKNTILEESASQNNEVSSGSVRILTKEEIFAEIDTFLHRAVHDLRSPLNAIKNITSWIQEDIDDGLTDDNDKNFSMVANSTKRMERLLTDLSIYSQIGRELHPAESFSLKTLVNESCVAVQLPNSFNVSVEQCKIELPREPLLFVLNHLLSNAIKHHDKTQGNINISYTDELEHFHLSISDDGPGIPETYQKKVFEAFQTLKSKDQVEGSGLGLTMIQKTLAFYSAEINVESQENEGATFTITWPKHNINSVL